MFGPNALSIIILASGAIFKPKFNLPHLLTIDYTSSLQRQCNDDVKFHFNLLVIISL